MTKDETVALVERIWATWAMDLPQAIRKQTYNAWHRIVEDLNAEDCNKALDLIVIEDSPWPPRPGTLRRRVQIMLNPTPSASEAWAQLRDRVDAVSHGGDVEPLHPLVAKVAQGLGVTASHALHTNGDRDLFMRRYEEARAAWVDPK